MENNITEPANEQISEAEHVRELPRIKLSDPSTWEPWMHVFVVRDCLAASRAAARAKLCEELKARGVEYVD